ncbi:MAG: hypothetical protein LBT84_02270 [Spirochaetia bacterium]|jgi:hypothetical protein|nr:hypothetical protein [Spirochaetia bacterium]
MDDDLNFDSLFGDASLIEESVESVEFQEPEIEPEPVVERPVAQPQPSPGKKRSSKDFEPDMDMLLITAQSSMIIEGMKALTNKDYSGKKLPVYLEAFRGIELYVKILERNPDNYNKLSPIINQDPDCEEVETIAFNLYRHKYKDRPVSDGQKLIAYEIFRDRMKNAYYKSLISQTMVGIKNYYLMSGSINEDKIKNAINSNHEKLKSDIEKISRTVAVAVELVKSGNIEISEGLKGRDVNLFIIRATELLVYYYTKIQNKQSADYYQRINDMYSKYLIVR